MGVGEHCIQGTAQPKLHDDAGAWLTDFRSQYLCGGIKASWRPADPSYAESMDVRERA